MPDFKLKIKRGPLLHRLYFTKQKKKIQESKIYCRNLIKSKVNHDLYPLN